MATLSKLQPYLDSQATLDLLMTSAYSKIFMENIDQNQFQPINTNNEHRALHENNISRNESIPNGETQTKRLLSTYTNDEKKWLVTTADEERSKGTGFMLRLKRRGDKQYPEKNHAPNQNLRDNVARLKKELEMNVLFHLFIYH